MSKEREPIAWITKGGKHIPIFADEPTEDEKKKDREIEENKKQADEKNKVKREEASENKKYVIKRLVKNGFGLPEAIKVYNQLSNDGFYEIEKKELTDWIKKNGY